MIKRDMCIINLKNNKYYTDYFDKNKLVSARNNMKKIQTNFKNFLISYNLYRL